MCSSMPERSDIESGPAQPNLVVRSLDQALLSLSADPFQSICASVFVIGGGQVYKEAVAHPACEGLHVTEIQASPDCDTFFPTPAEGEFQLWSKSGTVRSKEHSMVFKFYTRCCLITPT
jgi:dihydrofolate reductase